MEIQLSVNIVSIMGQDMITEIFTGKKRVNVTNFGDDKNLRAQN